MPACIACFSPFTVVLRDVSTHCGFHQQLQTLTHTTSGWSVSVRQEQGRPRWFCVSVSTDCRRHKTHRFACARRTASALCFHIPVLFLADLRRSASPGTRSLHRQGSVLSTVSAAGGACVGLTAAGDAGTQHLTPQQLGVMGECAHHGQYCSQQCSQ